MYFAWGFAMLKLHGSADRSGRPDRPETHIGRTHGASRSARRASVAVPADSAKVCKKACRRRMHHLKVGHFNKSIQEAWLAQL